MRSRRRTASATELAANTNPANYEFHYLPGVLSVIEVEEEVSGDIPITEESEKKVDDILQELAASDPKAGSEPFVKYQLTVSSTNELHEADETSTGTRTSPSQANEDAVRQIELVDRLTVQGVDGLSEEPDQVKVKVNRSTNALSGKVTWTTVGANGRSTRLTGTVKSGGVVNGIGYGTLSIKGMGLRSFICTCK